LPLPCPPLTMGGTPGAARCSTRGGTTVTRTVLGLPADRLSLTSWSTSSDVSRRSLAAPSAPGIS
jgi:hypothetical protein